MKKRLIGISVSAALGALLVLPTAFAAPEETGDFAPMEEQRREQLLHTLDNLEATADGFNMSSVLSGHFETARERVLMADSKELREIPADVVNNLRIIELTSGQMRLMYDPELKVVEKGGARIQMSEQGPAIQSVSPDYDSTDLPAPGYPDVDWAFGFDAPDEPDEDEYESNGSGDGNGPCVYPGFTVPTRFAVLNTAIALEAIKDIAEQACGQSGLGFNASLACVVTDIAAFVAIGINENQDLCNDFMTAAEVTASWDGIQTVHGNVQHVHDDLADVDSDLAAHDATVKTQISVHDSDIKSQVANHDSDIKSQVAIHDADLKAQLSQHDSDIKDRLGEIQGTVDENQRLIKIAMSRQAELMRLMITPEGRRDINPVVLSCTGDNCPEVDEIIACKGGLGWPCK